MTEIVFIDDGENADWIKGRAWEFASDPDAFIAEIGLARLPHFLTLPAARAMPESLRQALPDCVRRVAEALLMEHPGHPDQSVHNPHRISVRAVGEEMVRGKPREWPPGNPTSMAGLPEAHQAKIRALTAAAFDGLTDEQMDANLEAVLKRGMANPTSAKGVDWYEAAHAASSEVAEIGGISVEHGVGIVAALSPQHEWGSNEAAARYVARMVKENPTVPDLSKQMTKDQFVEGVRVKQTKTLEEWARGEMIAKGLKPPDSLVGTKLADHDPMTQAALIKAMSQAGFGVKDGRTLQFHDDVTGKTKGVQWSCGLDGVSKAIRIARGEAPGTVLNGHKVRSFYNNMLSGRSNPDPDVTIDTHAVSAAAGRKWAATSAPLKAFGSGTSLKSHGSVGLYAQFADGYRRVAAKHGMTVHEAQAVIWLQWRSENG